MCEVVPVACCCHLFLPSMCTYCITVHSPVDGHFCHFQFGATLNSAVISILFQVSECIDEYIFVGAIPRVGLLHQRVHIYPVLVVTLEKQFSKVFISVYISDSCSAFLPILGIFRFCFCFLFHFVIRMG